MQNLGHSLDLSVDFGADTQVINNAAFFLQQQAPDPGFDCAGCLGSAGSFGGTLGTFGTFGCCC